MEALRRARSSLLLFPLLRPRMLSRVFEHRPSLGPVVVAALLAGIAFALWQGPSLWWLVAYGTHFVIFTFGVGFGLHRLQAHRAQSVQQWLSRLAAAVGVLAQGGSPLSWRTIHILH